MHQICTHQDHYIRELIREAKMLWKVTLSNGVVCWSDPDRYAEDVKTEEGFQRIEDENLKPWSRLKVYCEKNDLTIVKVQVVVMGAPEEVIYEDSDGADGIFVKRGFSRSQDMETGNSQAFQNLLVGVLNDDCDKIDVVKYSWPHNEFEPYEQKRNPTQENIDQMIFKKGSEKWKKVKSVVESEVSD